MASDKDNMSMNVYSLMQEGRPFKTYKKVIPTWVSVTVFNVFSDRPERLTLKGDPAKNDLSCYVPLWSEKEFLFFKRSNGDHIEKGRLVESEYPEEKDVPVSPNNLTEEEIVELVNAPWMTMKSKVGKMDSEAAIYRVVQIAEQQDRPEKTMKFLRDALSRIQSGIEDESEDDK